MPPFLPCWGSRLRCRCGGAARDSRARRRSVWRRCLRVRAAFRARSPWRSRRRCCQSASRRNRRRGSRSRSRPLESAMKSRLSLRPYGWCVLSPLFAGSRRGAIVVVVHRALRGIAGASNIAIESSLAASYHGGKRHACPSCQLVSNPVEREAPHAFPATGLVGKTRCEKTSRLTVAALTRAHRSNKGHRVNLR